MPIDYAAGPWEVSATGHKVYQSEKDAGDYTPFRPKTLLCTLERFDFGTARLIAAAPSLIEALDRILGQCQDLSEYGEEELRERMREIRRLAHEALDRSEGR